MSEDLFGACVVCGCEDARALTTTRLSRGEVVVVCGTHELMHRRLTRRAESASELRAMLRDRRSTAPRRKRPVDELAARLSEAFAVPSNRRQARERRRAG